ncbi:MAG: cupredoxin domain-containing protein [Arenimonas sp.]
MRSTLLLLLALLSTTAVSAAEPTEIILRIKDHKFVPAQVAVPANTKFKLIVVNEDPTPEEFESHELTARKSSPARAGS